MEQMDWEDLYSWKYSGEEWDQRWTRVVDKGPAMQALHTPRTAGGRKWRTVGLSLVPQESNGGRDLK